MTALTNPLSVADEVLWLGAAPVSGGRGIALTGEAIVLHDLDTAPRRIPWSDVQGLDLGIEVSRWRRPALASWTLGMVGAALDIFSAGLPDDVELRIETSTGQVEHVANAHNRGGYPRDKVEALRELLDRLVLDPVARAELRTPDVVRDTLARTPGTGPVASEHDGR
jgi:hypothetical protein